MQRLIVAAVQFAPNQGEYRMVLLSDGAFDLERPELLRDLPLDYIGIGTETANVGIVAFTYREPVNGLSEYEMLIGLRNSGSAPFYGRLTVSAESGIILENSINLAPFEHSTIVFPYDGLLAKRIRAEISPGDAFNVDDSAYAVLSGGGAVRVHLSTPGNFFLEQVLLSHPNTVVTTSRGPPNADSFDIAIFDRVPPPLGFEGRALLIGTVDFSSMKDLYGAAENPEVTGWLHGHPLIKSVDLTGISVFRSLGIPREDTAITSVVHSGDISLLYTILEEQKSLVGISFDVSESNLPLQAAFPVLITNILAWLSPDSRTDRQALTGGTYATVVTEAEGVTVTRPDGSTEMIKTNAGEALITGLEYAGFYSIDYGDKTQDFAANLLNPLESDIAPRFVMWESERGAKVASEAGYEPLWRLLLLTALLLVLAEWIAWMRVRR